MTKSKKDQKNTKKQAIDAATQIVSKEKSDPFLKWQFQFNDEKGKYEFETLELSDGSEMDLEAAKGAFKRATGSGDMELAEKILLEIAFGMSSDSHPVRLNKASSLLPALNPENETEALLLGQFLALQDSGMNCLRNANSQSMFYHVEKFFNLATKLFNTANQTMHALMKYRTGGQQTVQVVHMHNEGQAILTQNLSHERGGGDE